MSTKPKAEVKKPKPKVDTNQPKGTRRVPTTYRIDFNGGEYEPLPVLANGFQNAHPFVWIVLEDNIEKQKEFYDGSGIALRENLVSLNVKNEKGKYPQVDIEVLLPNALSLDTLEEKRLDLLTLGANIYVYFGYTSAHTRKGPYTIKSREIDYGSGTVSLKISASMGVKLNKTTTSNVVTKLGDKSVFDVLSNIVGIKADYSEILEEEFKKSREAISNRGSDQTIGQRMWHHSTELDVDLYIDDGSNQVRLQTPYTFDLIARGKKPLRMTYGFPNSNIKKITYSEKLPNRKNTGGSKGVVGNTQFFIGGSVDKKTGLVRQLVHGVLRTSSDQFLNFGNPYAAIHNINDKDGKKKIEQKFSSDKYLVRRNDDLPISFTGQDVYYNIYRVFTANRLYEVSKYENKKLNQIEFVDLVNKGFIVVIVGEGIGADLLIPVKVYSTNKEQARKLQTGTKVKGTPTSTTSKMNISKQGVVYEETLIEKFSIPTKVVLNAEQSKKKAEAVQKLNNYKADSKYLVKEKKLNTITKYKVYEKVRTDPSKIKKEKEVEEQDPKETTTASSDKNLRSKSAPTGKTGLGSGNKKATARKSERELKIELASGDWTLPVGSLIELIDLHSVNNGVYVVEAENHDISSSGYRTSLTCTKALSKGKNKSAKKGKGGTRKDGQNEKDKATINKSKVTVLKTEQTPTVKKDIPTTRKTDALRPMQYGMKM